MRVVVARRIVKVQLPLVATTPEPFALIYEKGKAGMQMREVDAALLAKMEGEVKRFFYATVEDGKWVLGKPAPRQNW